MDSLARYEPERTTIFCVDWLPDAHEMPVPWQHVEYARCLFQPKFMLQSGGFVTQLPDLWQGDDVVIFTDADAVLQRSLTEAEKLLCYEKTQEHGVMIGRNTQTGAWRYPGAHADANFNLQRMVGYIQKLEHGKFDAFFMADHLAVLNMPMTYPAWPVNGTMITGLLTPRKATEGTCYPPDLLKRFPGYQVDLSISREADSSCGWPRMTSQRLPTTASTPFSPRCFTNASSTSLAPMEIPPVPWQIRIFIAAFSLIKNRPLLEC